ncbi:unnamed protein product [Thelazia callipaeda]|uniref:Uncharacterized protein n=1 Tax=Thelazia callipaeda TaxID=103827 RepID=A0A0N5CNU8_THECL|nr:unnamed protein product [Thelazia callipaeda]
MMHTLTSFGSLKRRFYIIFVDSSAIISVCIEVAYQWQYTVSWRSKKHKMLGKRRKLSSTIINENNKKTNAVAKKVREGALYQYTEIICQENDHARGTRL